MLLSIGCPGQFMSKENYNSEAGFMVAEALITVSIVTIMVASVLVIIAQGFSSIRSADQALVRASLATSLLEQVGSIIPLKPGIMIGRSEQGLHWRLAIKPIDTAQDTNGGNLILYNVDCSVSEGDGAPRWLLRPDAVTLKIGRP